MARAKRLERLGRGLSGGVTLDRTLRLGPFLDGLQIELMREAIRRGVEVPDCLSAFITNRDARRKFADTSTVGDESHDEAYARIAAAERAASCTDCPVCSLSAFEHPSEIERGYAWLNVLCDGRRVKL